MEIRKRNISEQDEEPPKAITKIEQFDVFTKLPAEYKEKSISGGTITVVTFLLMFLLIIIEIYNFIDSPIKFTYDIDNEFDSKLRINVDMSIAMPCGLIGADVIDQTGNTVESENALNEEDVNFELSANGKLFHQYIKSLQKEKNRNFNSLKHLVMKKNNMDDLNLNSKLHAPIKQEQDKKGCRIHGSVYVSKMPGNFHVTAGKHVELGFIGGHAHLTGFMSQADYNFSHIIHHFSFGDRSSNVLNPLDSEESIVSTNLHLFQYYIQVVATKVRKFASDVNTYQYAVREQHRSINHGAGSHGMPGIFMRYDISPLRVTVSNDNEGIVSFLVHLSAVIGGVFATSSFLFMIGTGCIESACRKIWKTSVTVLPTSSVSG